VTEPSYGSDVASIQCRAVRQPDGSWSVSGTKLWCTFAGRAHLLMLLCRTGGPGHRGLSLFVAEKPSSLGHEFEHRQDGGGHLRGRAIPTIGYRGMHTFELEFDDYRLPPDALVGEEGRGFYLQLTSFAPGRLQTAARAVGVMQAAVRDALVYTAQRRVFGRPIAEHALARQFIGRMGVRLHASRQLSYAAARSADPRRGETQAALAKLYASRMAEYVTRDAMQLFGGMGYGEETDVSRYFVDARVLTIFEGAEEVLALRVIGRALDDDNGGETQNVQA
jgi:(2S)-methylsuccinyl-CoA dehydrogenase